MFKYKEDLQTQLNILIRQTFLRTSYKIEKEKFN